MAYEFQPDAISSLVPAPQYVEKPLKNKKVGSSKDNQYDAERFRTGAIQKRQNEARYFRGRLYSHIKLEQIRSGVETVRDKMTQKAKKTSKTKRANQTYEKFEVDDQLNLPIGTDYDFIIKKKAEEIDN